MAEDTKKETKSEKRFRCVVHRLNIDRENADLPISVDVIGKKKRVFYPGEEVVLHDYHIEVLDNAVDSTELELPAESGIYTSGNPLQQAMKNYPGFKAIRDEVDGSIKLFKNTKMYSVEKQGPA